MAWYYIALISAGILLVLLLAFLKKEKRKRKKQEFEIVLRKKEEKEKWEKDNLFHPLSALRINKSAFHLLSSVLKGHLLYREDSVHFANDFHNYIF